MVPLRVGTNQSKEKDIVEAACIIQAAQCLYLQQRTSMETIYASLHTMFQKGIIMKLLTASEIIKDWYVTFGILCQTVHMLKNQKILCYILCHKTAVITAMQVKFQKQRGNRKRSRERSSSEIACGITVWQRGQHSKHITV